MTRRNDYLNAGATMQNMGAETGKKVAFTAPYAFVPLGKVLPSPWGGERPRHDRPEPDGVGGTLRVQWTSEQPLLIGGPGKDKDDATAFLKIDGEYHIPGGTLRGLIRNTLEIAVGARMRLADREVNHSVRDMKDEDYWSNRNPSKHDGAMAMRAGWLMCKNPKDIDPKRPDPKAWSLRLCERWTVKTADLLANWFKPFATADFEKLHVLGKYNWLKDKQLGRVVELDLSDPTAPKFKLHGSRQIVKGLAVLTGTDPQGVKASETIFYDEVEATAAGIPLAPAVVRRLFDTYGTSYRVEGSDTGALGYWLEEYRADRIKPFPGVPVFVVFDKNAVGARTFSLKPEVARDKLAAATPDNFYLAMSRMVKAPHRYSIGEVLDRNGHKLEGPLDFTEALFGFVPPEDGRVFKPPHDEALKGRVFFGMAKLDNNKNEEDGEPRQGFTMSPRPSYWPFYAAPSDEVLGQASAKVFDWSNKDTTVAGWKRYPVRTEVSPFPQPQKGEGANAVSKMKFLNPGASFTGDIRFHNLKPAELGALVWAITWGGVDQANAYRHAIGRGKAQGFGRARAAIVSSMLARNDGKAAAADFLQSCVRAFKAHVKDAYNTSVSAAPARKVEEFDCIPAVADLLAMADPAIGASLHGRLKYPEADKKPGSDESRSLAGYRLTKAAAREGKIGPAKRTLPLYPRNV